MEIKILWQKFMTAFAPSTFNPGINTQQIDTVGIRLPKELKEIYLLSNGQDEKSIGIFQSKSGYGKFSRPRLLSIEQIDVLWYELKETKYLDVFELWYIPFAVNSIECSDDVFCFDTQTGKILLLWVLAWDPFNPPDWQYDKFEVADSLEQFIKDQSELAGVKIVEPAIVIEPKPKPGKTSDLIPTVPIADNGGVILYYLEVSGCKATIQAYFNGESDLVIDGYDIGKFVEEMFGDSDYEYQMTIRSLHVTKLYKLFNIPLDSKQELLYALAKRHNTGTCFSEIKDYLDDNNIKYEYFSWT